MAATYYFLSAPNDHGVLDWFRSQTETAEKHSNEVRVLLHYCQFGALAQNADGSFDPSRSPIVSIFFPKVRRGALWTVGEVHFIYKSKEFPALERLRKRFQAWINESPAIWERKHDGREAYGYYLDGTVKNIADVVFALPSGLTAYEAGQYFVAESDNEGVLDRVCGALRLRGIDCS
ncbi:hypothetical protein [Sphingopyxis sp. KK2]|uniref:hypothetical protein n=1 Tax=Sphingopyxis sp. KK2 TaxID=1855727 RepID=UPI001181A360|nr:hypothetical protein [Sphingopyxis sp. KK2]